jgi:NADPH2:quinone reductase
VRALIADGSEDLADLRVGEWPEPIAGDGMVVVEVEAASVDFVDTLSATGRYQVKIPPPFVPGNNVAGTVAEIGSGVAGFEVGDRVHGMAFLGGFAERVAVAAANLRPTPAGLAPDLACLTGAPYRTAYDSLASTAKVRPGEDLVILGASGAVGSAAIMIGKALGARLVACASSAEKLEFCRSLGADAGVLYSGPSFKEELKEACGGAADVVIDLVGGGYSEPALRAVGYGGRFVVVGFAAGGPARVPLNLVLLKGSIVLGYEILDFERHEAGEAARNRDALEELLMSGTVRPPITGRFPLEKAAEAMALVGGREKLGVTVLDLTRGDRRSRRP